MEMVILIKIFGMYISTEHLEMFNGDSKKVYDIFKPFGSTSPFGLLFLLIPKHSREC